jgi:hypothetical protein
MRRALRHGKPLGPGEGRAKGWGAALSRSGEFH